MCKNKSMEMKPDHTKVAEPPVQKLFTNDPKHAVPWFEKVFKMKNGGCTNVTTILMLLIVFIANRDIYAASGDDIKITQGAPDVILPRETTDNKPARYGIGLPLQVSSTEAAIFCNLRVIAPGMFDYEDGTDVFIFDSIRTLRTAKPIAVSRNQKRTDTETGKEQLIVKFPLAGGFWPLGAKAVDGSRHPGEGRGFGFCQALSFETDEKGLFKWVNPFVRYVEILQCSYNGTQFQVTKRDLVGPTQLPAAGPNGWQLVSQGLTNAIPDGNDLLQPVLAQRNGQQQCGLCRWQWRAGQWTAITILPVGSGSEPSLVRVADGSLMFTMRLTGKQGGTLVAWRSGDTGRTWQEVVRKTNVGTASPVSIICTASGVPLIATNPHGAKRARLSFWTIDDKRLSAPRPIRDCIQEFGKRPQESFWCIDHPSSAVVRLADGQWHALLAYRIKTFFLPTRGREEPIVPQTGCYVEEIISTGTAIPVWRF